MKYINYLKTKNFSKITIDIYLKEYNKWKIYLKNKNPNKSLFTKYINNYSKTHSPNSVRLMYFALLSIFKFEKRWNLVNQCKDIRLPKIQEQNKTIISLKEFNRVEKYIEIETFKQKRNWLIFCFLFFTGTRVCELLQFNKKSIYEKNKIKIKGKGNKTRVVFLPKYLISLLNDWKYEKIAFSNKKTITSRQINVIVKNIGINYFNKKISPHSLRRSYATNLLKNNANIEIVRKTLGHSNINTTARYLQFNDDDISTTIDKIFNSKTN